MKGSMYQHASISAVVNKGIYDGLVSYGMQYPDYFDDSLFRVDPTQEDMSHKPTLSLVLLALIVTAVGPLPITFSTAADIFYSYAPQ